MQVVPEAMGMMADQAPEAHRWKLEPPMQFQFPSFVQAPVRPPPTPPAGGALEGAGGAAPPDVAAGGGLTLVGVADTTGVLVTAEVWVTRVVAEEVGVGTDGADGADGGTVTKTPPGGRTAVGCGAG